MTHGPNAVQLDCTDPVVPETLQCPKTASSGRKPMAMTRGGSYGFLASAWFDSKLIQASILGSHQWPPQLPQALAMPGLFKI